MKELCKIVEPYKCKDCGSDLLFFITSDGWSINYKEVFYKRLGMSLSDIRNELVHRKVKYFKCLGCGKIHFIDWSNGFPVQLTDGECLKKFGV